jgi:hypothetical protein
MFAGLWLVSRSVKTSGRRDGIFLLLSALTFAAWMLPRHKLFDISLSLILMAVLTFLIANPTGKRHFVTGLCTGLAAFFGRNHGMYAVVGGLGVMVWLNIRQSGRPGLVKGLKLWAAGILVGFSPTLLMLLFVPGFGSAFGESILYTFSLKGFNLPLPVPWPWRIGFASLPVGAAIRGWLIGMFLIGIVVFGVLSLAWALLQRFRNKPVTPALAAVAFLSLPYAHYAYSRADVGHLAHGIFPLLVGCLALLAVMPAKVKWPLATLFCTASIWTVYVFHPGVQYTKQWVEVTVSNNKLKVDPETANNIALLRTLADRYAPHGQSFLVVPFWVGAYPLLERRSPLYDIYPILPRLAAFEQEEIERIKAADPKFALVEESPLDGREDLRFRNTHPLTYQYIQANFEPISGSPNPAINLYQAKAAGR